MYHLAFYVPSEYADRVKEKIFQAGGGRIGNYDKCSFEYEGRGQFRPLTGSTPFVGEEYRTEIVSEIKVEMVCEEQYLAGVIKALKESHPYESPAYYVVKTLSI